MGKRGQVSVYIGMGILFLVLFGLFMVSKKDAYNEQDVEFDQLALKQDKAYVQQLVNACLRDSLLEAKELGLRKELKQQQERLIEEKLEKCADFSVIESRGVEVESGQIKVQVSLEDSFLSANVKFPITIKRRLSSISMEDFSESIDRKVSVFMDGKASALVTGDRSVELKIAEGTTVALAGKPVESIGLKIIDKAEASASDVVLGNVLYELLPEGAVFSQPAELSFFSKTPFTIAHFDTELGVWVEEKSIVNKDAAKITAQITEFAKYAPVLCGESKDPNLWWLCSKPVTKDTPLPKPRPVISKPVIDVSGKPVCTGEMASEGFMSCPLHVSPQIITGSLGSGHWSEHCGKNYPLSGCNPSASPHWAYAIDVAGPGISDSYDVYLPSINGKPVTWEFQREGTSGGPGTGLEFMGYKKFFTAEADGSAWLIDLTHIEREPILNTGDKFPSGTLVGNLYDGLDAPGIGHVHIAVEKDGRTLANPEIMLNLCQGPREQSNCI